MCAYAASGKPSDRAMEIYARFNAQRKKANGSADFNDYLRIRIIGNTGNRVKGDAFEARMVKKFNMVGPDRWCQDPVPYKDPKTGKTKHRIMDSAFASTDAGRVLLEADPQLKHVYVYTGGGVDFSKSPKRNITRVEFGLEHPGLDKTTRTSVQTVTTYRDTDTVFLGGNSNGTRPTSPGGDDPAPEPTPTEPDEPRPSDDPSTPAPGPSDSPGGDQRSPPGNRPDPDGDLADTGSDTPIGLLSAPATAVVATGGTLVWWTRRRRAAHE